MLRRVLTLSIVLALVSVTLGSSGLRAHTKSMADYDLKTLAIVVNRDSSDVTIIDPVTDAIIKRIPLGEYTNAHMAMLNHDGKKLIISATGRDRFLVVDLVTDKVEHTIVTGKAPEHFDATPDGTAVPRQERLTLLINAGTASSAELFAGVLQWHRRAKLVGSPTSGKRTVQQVVRLDQAHLLLLTTGRFLAPDGSPFGVHGLTPDRVYEGDDAVSLMMPCADTTPAGP